MTPRPAARVAAALLLAGCAARAPRPALPPPPPPALAPLVGLYARGADTLLVLEADGRLHLLGPDSARHALAPRDDGRLVARAGAPDSAVLRAAGGGATLDVGGVAHRRAVATEAEGASFRIVPRRPLDDIRREARAAVPPPQPDARRAPDLVELVALDPTIRLDVRYATADNFMGARLYDAPRAFLQRPAAEALVRVHRALAPLGYGLLVFDAYRPWAVTWMFWEATPDHQRDFVADPASGSRHNRGAAVDLTLYELATGRAVAMPSGYDEFTRRAHAEFPGGTARQRAHRALLRRAMEVEGFAVYAPEWWHFDHAGWRDYPVLNVRLDVP